MHITTEKNARRRGMTSVEFAMIMPLLLLVVMGLIEGGNAAYSWLTVQKAAQNGAHFAATGRGEEEGTRLVQIIEVTQKSLVTLKSGTKEVSIRSWPDLSATGDGIDNNAGGPCQMAEVSVLYHYKPVTPLIATILPDTIPLYGYDRKVNEPWKPCD